MALNLRAQRIRQREGRLFLYVSIPVVDGGGVAVLTGLQRFPAVGAQILFTASRLGDGELLPQADQSACPPY